MNGSMNKRCEFVQIIVKKDNLGTSANKCVSFLIGALT